jgi:hypothetical protein
MVPSTSVVATTYYFLPFSNYSYLAIQLNSSFRLFCLYSVSTSLLATANAYYFLPFSARARARAHTHTHTHTHTHALLAVQ